jgi:LmbE family N-acetylglucosaminyl deacetylase
MIIAPHMDDESMGCGGLMAKYPDECVVVIVTDSGPIRAAEHARAMQILGVTRHHSLGFEDGVTDQHMTELVGAIDAVMGARPVVRSAGVAP